MISISGKKWTERNINGRIIEKTSIDNNFTYDLSNGSSGKLGYLM